MTGFSNGVSMAYRFYCEKPDLVDGLVTTGYVWTDPWKPYKQSKPPYEQCAAANLTKKAAFYTACGTDDVYCNLLSFQEEWEWFSTGVLGCTGTSKEIGSYADFPAGPKTCYGYESCPGMNTACRVAGQEHTGQIGADAVHHAFASFFNMTLGPLPPAPKTSKYDPGKDKKKKEDDGKDKMKGDDGKDKIKGDDGKNMKKSEDDSVQTTTSSASIAEGATSSAFVALLSSATVTVVSVNSVAAVLG